MVFWLFLFFTSPTLPGAAWHQSGGMSFSTLAACQKAGTEIVAHVHNFQSQVTGTFACESSTTGAGTPG
jgi:hypothetical protein